MYGYLSLRVLIIEYRLARYVCIDLEYVLVAARLPATSHQPPATAFHDELRPGP